MKTLLYPVLFGLLAGMSSAQTPATPASSSTPAAAAASTPAKTSATKLVSHVYEWDKLVAVTKPNGVRRDVFDAPTTTLDKLHCHITTLNPGERSGQPTLHLQEEVIIVKEGTIEATHDGVADMASAGSVIYFAANATTCLRNPGTTPATYIVINYYPPVPAKS